MDDKPVNVVWMKDNKVLEEKKDKIVFSETGNNSFQLEIKNCTESDSGTYIARATNGFENATCTAQLTVEKSKFK